MIFIELTLQDSKKPVSINIEYIVSIHKESKNKTHIVLSSKHRCTVSEPYADIIKTLREVK